MSALLRIGTRGSPLALAQAHMTQAALAAATGAPAERFPIVIIKTSGDMIQDRALAESGGKGLFTKEIDEAQLRGEIDLSVHSGKDLPTALPDGLAEAGYLPRADVRDAFIGHRARRLDDLPQGARIGTASLRRAAQLRRARPDLRIELLRGNVETRLRKVADGECDATLLAMAGLTRLGLADRAHEILPVERFLPAVAQGAIGLVTRAGDNATADLVAAIVDEDTTTAVAAERRFLARLDGSCRTPIAGHARIADGRLALDGEALSPDGGRVIADRREGPREEAGAVGDALGLAIRARLPADFFG
jgi:hydroxymethylbilane synthase